MRHPFKLEEYAGFVLRAGLIFVFAYAGIDALREPSAWIIFFPPWISHIGSAQTLLSAFAYFQIFLAFTLLWRPFVAYAAGIAALLLLGIATSNISSLLVVFRDFGLVTLALGLAALEWPQRAKRFLLDS